MKAIMMIATAALACSALPVIAQPDKQEDRRPQRQRIEEEERHVEREGDRERDRDENRMRAREEQRERQERMRDEFRKRLEERMQDRRPGMDRQFESQERFNQQRRFRRFNTPPEGRGLYGPPGVAQRGAGLRTCPACGRPLGPMANLGPNAQGRGLGPQGRQFGPPPMRDRNMDDRDRRDRGSAAPRQDLRRGPGFGQGGGFGAGPGPGIGQGRGFGPGPGEGFGPGRFPGARPSAPWNQWRGQGMGRGQFGPPWDRNARPDNDEDDERDEPPGRPFRP